MSTKAKTKFKLFDIRQSEKGNKFAVLDNRVAEVVYNNGERVSVEQLDGTTIFLDDLAESLAFQRDSGWINDEVFTKRTAYATEKRILREGYLRLKKDVNEL